MVGSDNVGLPLVARAVGAVVRVVAHSVSVRNVYVFAVAFAGGERRAKQRVLLRPVLAVVAYVCASL